MIDYTSFCRRVVLVLGIFFCEASFAQYTPIAIDQSLIQAAVIEDPRFIRFFADDFMIPEEKITKITIYDLSGDGFGSGDLAITSPGRKYYSINPGNKIQAIMNNWGFGGNIKFTADAANDPEQFEQGPDSIKAMGGIFASLLKGLRRNYKGMSMKLYLEQNDNITAVEMWGYDPKLMRYQPEPVPTVALDKPVMKLIYLEKTVVDSVYYPLRQARR